MALATVAPQLALILSGLLVMASGRAGLDAEWTESAMTLPEAVYSGDVAQAIRRIDQGEDPAEPHLVRKTILDHGPERAMSALEAAIEKERNDIVAVVMRTGVVVDTGERHRLACLAAARDMPETAALLAGDPGALACSATTTAGESGER